MLTKPGPLTLRSQGTPGYGQVHPEEPEARSLRGGAGAGPPLAGLANGNPESGVRGHLCSEREFPPLKISVRGVASSSKRSERLERGGAEVFLS